MRLYRQITFVNRNKIPLPRTHSKKRIRTPNHINLVEYDINAIYIIRHENLFWGLNKNYVHQ